MSSTPPGWYPFPNDPRELRYWDGARWTEHTAPNPAFAPPNPAFAAPVPVSGVPTSPEPISGLAKAVQGLLGLMIVLSLFRMWAHWDRASLVNDVLSGGRLTRSAADAADARVRAAALLYVGGLIVTGIVWVVWFKRSYDNIARRSRPLVYSSGWAAGCWFVPFLNWVRPREIAVDLFRASSPAEPSIPGVVNVWWGFFVAGSLVAWLTRGFGDDTLREIRNRDRVASLSQIVTIVAAATAIVVVQRLTDRQKAFGAAV